jgi:hypothetical protein
MSSNAAVFGRPAFLADVAVEFWARLSFVPGSPLGSTSGEGIQLSSRGRRRGSKRRPWIRLINRLRSQLLL